MESRQTEKELMEVQEARRQAKEERKRVGGDQSSVKGGVAEGDWNDVQNDKIKNSREKSPTDANEDRSRKDEASQGS